MPDLPIGCHVVIAETRRLRGHGAGLSDEFKAVQAVGQQSRMGWALS